MSKEKDKCAEVVREFPLVLRTTTYRRHLGKCAKRIGRRPPKAVIAFRTERQIGKSCWYTDLSARTFDNHGVLTDLESVVTWLRPDVSNIKGSIRIVRLVTHTGHLSGLMNGFFSRDLKRAQERLPLDVKFAGVTQFGLGVISFAQKILDQISTTSATEDDTLFGEVDHHADPQDPKDAHY